MSDPEQGISQTQIAAAQAQSKQGNGLQKHHKWNVANLGDRIFFYVGALVVLGLFIVSLTASSALVLYGSLGIVVLLTIVWGVARILSINRIQKERERQVKAMQSEKNQRNQLV